MCDIVCGAAIVCVCFTLTSTPHRQKQRGRVTQTQTHRLHGHRESAGVVIVLREPNPIPGCKKLITNCLEPTGFYSGMSLANLVVDRWRVVDHRIRVVFCIG